MREVLRQLAGAPDHVGLAYDMWAPIRADGKVPDEERDRWLEWVAATRVSADYQAAYDRWLASLRADGSRAVEVRLAGRLLLGHGNPAPTEVGLTVHHTWGVPIIPGSAIKGLLAHYLDAVYGPDRPGLAPHDASLGEEARVRARYQGVTWDGRRIVHGPGDVYRALFGAPAAASDDEYAAFGTGETAGLVTFHDALFVPGTAGDSPFAQDVLTVHHGDYYVSEGRLSPNDYESPTPVAFLTVRPGAGFLLALSGPAEWTGFALEHLQPALREWGVGGKTAAGYGRIDEQWREVVDPRRARLAASAALAEVRAVLDDGTLTQRDILSRLGAMVERLAAEPADVRAEITKLIKRIKPKKPQLQADHEALLWRLEAGQ
jgi:CRISPR-associated protein Cmr6